VLNLFLQLKVKTAGEEGRMASITVESGQLALRFPDGEVPANLPNLGPAVANWQDWPWWMPYNGASDWIEKLLDVLETLANKAAQSKSLIPNP